MEMLKKIISYIPSLNYFRNIEDWRLLLSSNLYTHAGTTISTSRKNIECGRIRTGFSNVITIGLNFGNESVNVRYNSYPFNLTNL